MSTEKRAWVRRELPLAISYKKSEETKKLIGAILPFSKKAKAINISGGGLLFSCSESIEPGIKITISFLLTEIDIKVKGTARVVGVYKKAKEFLIGAQFMELNIEGDEEVKALIEEAVKNADKEIIMKAKSRFLQKLVEQELMEQKIK